MNVGVNFFGPKRKLYHDFDGTLERLLNAGITSAEVCVSFGGSVEPPRELALKIPQEVLMEMSGGIWSPEDAPEKIARVRAAGLAVVSVHAMVMGAALDHLEDLIPTLKAFARENDIKYYVISLMKGLEDIKTFVPVLKKMSEELAADGVYLLYHNHEIECMVTDGTTALDYILEQCPKLMLELDVGWAKFAGADAVELMKKYAERLLLLHFKDIRADACPENRDTCFTPVGEGSIPLSDIMRAAKDCALDENGLIIDQDDSPTDILDDLAVGVDNIRKCS